ncbi:MAG: DUF3817 domain-containing protein [Actinomycetota bacterium]
MVTSAETELPEVRRFRLIAPIEATSLLVLVTTSLARVLLDGPDVSSVLGSAHGLLFTLYLVAVVQVQAVAGWSLGRTLLALLAAVVPFGGFVLAHRATS